MSIPMPDSVLTCIVELDYVEEKATQLQMELDTGVDRSTLTGTMNDLAKRLTQALKLGSGVIAAYMTSETATYDTKLGAVQRAFFSWRFGKSPLSQLKLALADLRFQLDILCDSLGLSHEGTPEQKVDVPDNDSSPMSDAREESRKQVFIVHGHDDAAEQSAARVVEKLGLKPVILHERARESRTVIEQLEICGDVGYAIVLLTPDDVGKAATDIGEPKTRARQNVILELGYFLGRLGRKHVCTLLKGDIEIPSDWKGVLYLRMDEAGAWRYELAKEMNAVGLHVDTNRL